LAGGLVLAQNSKCPSAKLRLAAPPWVSRRQINPFKFIVSIEEIAVANAVRLFIQEDKDARRIPKIGQPQELLVFGIGHVRPTLHQLARVTPLLALLLLV